MSKSTSVVSTVGRPVIFRGRLARHVVSLARKNGNAPAVVAILAGEGTSISLPTVRKLCARHNVVLRGRGRPARLAA